MEKISIGLELMGIGMVTVFAILLIVIFGSRLLITIINRIAPEESKPETAAPAADDTAAVRPVLDAAVAQLTGGKGHIVKITKISC